MAVDCSGGDACRASSTCAAGLRTIGVLLLFLLFGDVALGQDLDPLIPVRVGSEFGFRDPDSPDRYVIVVIGGVELKQGPRRLLADTLVLVLDTSDDDTPGLGPVIPASKFVEAFLDGNVTVEEGDEIVVGAQSLLLNGTTGELTVIDGSWRTALRNETVMIRFGLMRRLQDGTHEFENLTYTTCDYAHAHWGVDTPWAVLIPTPDGRILKTGLSTGWVGDVPLVIGPGLYFNIDRDLPPLRRVQFGDSREFGTEIETVWGADASEFLTDFAASALGVDAPVTGKWKVELANYSSRGVFLQPEWRWATEMSSGRLMASGIRDNNDEDYLPSSAAAGVSGRIEDETRGRFKLEHRTKLDDHRTVDAELSYLSDRGFLEEYYEDESRVVKPPETYVSYRDVENNQAFTMIAKGRANDFLDVIEYLPKIERRQVGEPISWLGGGFLTSRDIASYARHRDESSPEGVASPVIPLVVLTAGIDVTVFNNRFHDDLSTPLVMESQRETLLRHALIGGASWSQTWSGSRPARSDTWNIDGLRHILEPSVSFNSVLELNYRPHVDGTVSHGAGDLISLDNVEALDKLQFFVVGMRHRLQTHRRNKTVTILDTEVFMPIYPNERRDNPNEPETNGYVVLLSKWNPGADIWGLRKGQVSWQATLDLNGSKKRVKSSARYRTNIGEGKTIYITENVARLSAHSRAIGAEWVLTPRWSGAIYLNQDVLNNSTAAQGLILRQRAHKWIIDIELGLRRGRDPFTGGNLDDKRIKISFQPTAFGDFDRPILERLGRWQR